MDDIQQDVEVGSDQEARPVTGTAPATRAWKLRNPEKVKAQQSRYYANNRSRRQKYWAAKYRWNADQKRLGSGDEDI